MFQKWESNPYDDYRGVVAKSEIDNSPRITVERLIHANAFPGSVIQIHPNISFAARGGLESRLGSNHVW